MEEKIEEENVERERIELERGMTPEEVKEHVRRKNMTRQDEAMNRGEWKSKDELNDRLYFLEIVLYRAGIQATGGLNCGPIPETKLLSRKTIESALRVRAEAYEELGSSWFDEAALGYERVGEYEKAARCREKDHSFFLAAGLYEESQNYLKALELYNKLYYRDWEMGLGDQFRMEHHEGFMAYCRERAEECERKIEINKDSNSQRERIEVEGGRK
jgi:hypothetical protein